MNVQPYLYFDGRCEEALTFYGKVLGAQTTMLMRNNQSPEPPPPGMVPPGSENKVMHASFKIGDAELMASDGNCRGTPKFDGFAMALRFADVPKAQQVFAALSEGGKITMPLTKTFFSPSFGMLADKFGVHWMIMVQPS